MNYYPVFLQLKDKPCLVVGGGRVGERKVEGLLKAGARVTVVSPEVTPRLAGLAREGRIDWEPREYQPPDLKGKVLVFVATPDRQLNWRVAKECRERGIWVNVADGPEESSFLVPAVVRKGSLQVAISTGGQSPALAAWLRERIEEMVGKEYGSFSQFLAELRPLLKERFPEDQTKRADIFRKLARDTELLELVARGDKKAARERVERCLSGW
ncbi:MAG: bifunctional precorrin-2 dehydrogenase/sirohydrochlorin ferrochelatase [Thermanaeromonas sp.]|uniref:precorrin-2 dehydrogenase/sirohydrochlorin ferrochelatase family protein n=1 Tax=Thermanaeromonas sp. TaxID=2003697 RepID=UPI00243DF012|nr:bifunctional precorrin-2 dehydrogenase/sirohydrochlorin ferrochelatase [Thermanaeromonas sp.]MCG0277856.1 bifunctional precorrin-2 dehydrogenase/sirohydrochlorin ferrochelatase [Thermanaeromonas sp.]